MPPHRQILKKCPDADTIILASVLLRGIHPLIIFKMADVQGVNASYFISELAMTMASAF
jgi:hypothetical protein